jgi:ArsR family transcriptional regulator, virulence genes transcriptional regulator
MTAIDLSELKANAGAMAQRLKAMSHPERLMMLCRMNEGEVNVTELVALTGLSQSGVSQHLALLRADNMVLVRVDANTRWYRLRDPVVSGVIHALCALSGVTMGRPSLAVPADMALAAV